MQISNTNIISNGSKFYRQKPDPLETLIKLLKDEKNKLSFISIITTGKSQTINR